MEYLGLRQILETLEKTPTRIYTGKQTLQEDSQYEHRMCANQRTPKEEEEEEEGETNH